MLGFLRGYQQLGQYFPDGKEIWKCPKFWLADIGFTVVGEPFGRWVKAQIETRNQAVASKGNLNIAMDPDVAAAFAASTAVSTSKGIGANCKYNSI